MNVAEDMKLEALSNEEPYQDPEKLALTLELTKQEVFFGLKLLKTDQKSKNCLQSINKHVFTSYSHMS